MKRGAGFSFQLSVSSEIWMLVRVANRENCVRSHCLPLLQNPSFGPRTLINLKCQDGFR